jgi:hypothetical protein
VLDGDIVGDKIFDVVAVLLSQFYRGWPRIGRMTSITDRAADSECCKDDVTNFSVDR